MTEFLHLLGNPAHWAFEFTGEAITSLVAYPFIRFAVRLHDRKLHSTGIDLSPATTQKEARR